MKDLYYSDKERRQYTRIDSVLPVQFKLVDIRNGQYVSGWLQGFTNNIGKGGICLQVNTIDPALSAQIRERKVKLYIEVELSFYRRPIVTHAQAAWMKRIGTDAEKYLIGLRFESLNFPGYAHLMRYVRVKKIFVPAAVVILLSLAAGFFVNAYFNLKLSANNKKLVEQLVLVNQESAAAQQRASQIRDEKERFSIEITTLQSRIEHAEEERLKVAEMAKSNEHKAGQQIEKLNSLIARLNQEKGRLKEQLAASKTEADKASEALLVLDEKKAFLAKANLDKMYEWLALHQNPRTGLVVSFEGDKDLANWAFVYDQSLAAQAYVYFGDFQKAKKLLDFFAVKAKRIDGLFINAYYAADGSSAEYTVHSGPNIWLGIALLQYTQKAKDSSFVSLAEEIAQRIIALQNEDKDKGIRGGPSVRWYSTEHNLDAFAFFSMLARVTGKDEYRLAAEKVLRWLTRHTYDKTDIPILRGKGDATIATDTYAWSIAAIGPERLLSLGMNPDKIIEFAEENCAKEVSFVRPGGATVRVKGFDFAPQRHLARGGVVSTEWTAQMIVTLKIMAAFHQKKGGAAFAKEYLRKADAYIGELLSMSISSPSPSGQGEGCLPYASSDFVDTGHGWTTPKGSSTGSIAGTAYALFAYYGYNPLSLEE
ncbi:MAG: hypothetical protein C4540_02595 [Candidatus Omnitrophota bacterium]|jgi:hypothetical protein|nr:MAG: hypothetical protein C4540_02595 [Candidatus Omnitrophota bacterium]